MSLTSLESQSRGGSGVGDTPMKKVSFADMLSPLSPEGDTLSPGGSRSSGLNALAGNFPSEEEEGEEP